MSAAERDHEGHPMSDEEYAAHERRAAERGVPGFPSEVDLVDRLALVLGEAEDALRAARAAEWRARRERDAARETLRVELARLGGGTVAADTRREVLYFVENVADGAVVNQAACRRLADSLGPLDLAPQEQTTVVYPTVSALLRARSKLRRAGIDVRELLIEGPRVDKLRARARSGAGPV